MFRTRVFKLSVLVLFLAACCSSAMAKDKVDIQLTYPNGKSPKVFTVGWTFGVKAVLNPGTKGAKDISKQVKWSGSGTFSPSTGAVSHPSFSKAGANTIELSVKVGKQIYKEKFQIQTIKPDGFATVGDKAHCPADAHGCMACPHPVVGPIVSGSAKVKINGKGVARVGDTGVHAACCGPNTFKIVEGDPNVLIDGKPAAKLGSKTQHCGGVGTIVEASFVLKETPDDQQEEISTGFGGTWKTNWGTMTLAVSGSSVTGNYPHDQGRVEGTVSTDGRTLTGKWFEAPSYSFPNDGGKLVFTLSADGKSFAGVWGYGESTSGGTWNGTKIE